MEEMTLDRFILEFLEEEEKELLLLYDILSKNDSLRVLAGEMGNTLQILDLCRKRWTVKESQDAQQGKQESVQKEKTAVLAHSLIDGLSKLKQHLEEHKKLYQETVKLIHLYRREFEAIRERIVKLRLEYHKEFDKARPLPIGDKNEAFIKEKYAQEVKRIFMVAQKAVRERLDDAHKTEERELARIKKAVKEMASEKEAFKVNLVRQTNELNQIVHHSRAGPAIESWFQRKQGKTLTTVFQEWISHLESIFAKLSEINQQTLVDEKLFAQIRQKIEDDFNILMNRCIQRMNQSRMVAPDPNLGQLVDQMEHVLSAEIDAYFRDYRSRKIERKLNLYHFAELLGHGIKAIEETETKLAKMKEILDIVAQGEKKIS